MKKALYLILAGVAIGILVAPEKGEVTWGKIKAGFDDWKEDAIDQLNGISSKGKEVFGKGTNMVDAVKTEARETVNEW